MGILRMAPSYDHPMPSVEAMMVSPSFGPYGHEVGYRASCAASPACPQSLRGKRSWAR